MRIIATAVLFVLTLATAQAAQAQNRTGPGGQPPIVDLLTAGDLTFRNIGSRVDGAGMCVTTSIEFCQRYQGMDRWRGFRDWCAQFPGGGTPQKTDQLLTRYAQEKGLPPPADFLQVQGDTEPVIQLALKTGRPVAITDCGNPRLYGRPVAHMTTLVHLDDAYACIVDNNQPDREDWMTVHEFRRRHRHGGYAWAVVCLTPPPPPIPVNNARGGQIPIELQTQLLAGLIALQCGPGNACQPEIQQQLPGYRWEPYDDGDRRGWYLYDGRGAWLGSMNAITGKYWTRRGGQWLQTQPPTGPPAGPQQLFTGVDVAGLRHLPPGRAEIRYNGQTRDLDQRQIQDLVAGNLRDDSQRAHVVIGTGSPAPQRSFAQQLRASPEWRDLDEHVVIHERTAEHWHLAAVGYGGPQRAAGVTVTGPTRPNGTAVEVGFWPLADVEAHLDHIVAATVEAVRIADPNYRPTRRSAGDSDHVGIHIIIALAAFVLTAGLVAAIGAALSRLAPPSHEPNP